MSRLLLTVLFAMATLWTLPAHAAGQYEEGLKQLAEGVIAHVEKAKKTRLAVLDFTDSKGIITPIGQFLAEELSTQILVIGEHQSDRPNPRGLDVEEIPCYAARTGSG